MKLTSSIISALFYITGVLCFFAVRSSIRNYLSLQKEYNIRPTRQQENTNAPLTERNEKHKLFVPTEPENLGSLREAKTGNFELKQKKLETSKKRIENSRQQKETKVTLLSLKKSQDSKTPQETEKRKQKMKIEDSKKVEYNTKHDQKNQMKKEPKNIKNKPRKKNLQPRVKYTKKDAEKWGFERQARFSQSQINNFGTRSLTSEDYSNDQTSPFILVWTANKFQTQEQDRQLNRKFPNVCGGCVTTMNRTILNRASAVVVFNDYVHLRNSDIPDPRTRRSDQLYVFWNKETISKCATFKNLLRNPRIDGIFNLTMDYRRDANFTYYFGNQETSLRRSKFQDGKFWKNIKNKRLALWMVSNCDKTMGARKRMEYAKELMKAGLKLDVKGLCFADKKEKSNELYKFYLAFENSVHCPDYVSEKMWRNGFQSGAVPIVWGPTREDVWAVAPPHSYIHADDFPNARALVRYINYLDANDTAYNEYHKWREEPIDPTINYEDIKPGTESVYCRLCKFITKMKKTESFRIKSIYDWLYETKYVDDLCFKSEL